MALATAAAGFPLSSPTSMTPIARCFLGAALPDSSPRCPRPPSFTVGRLSGPSRRGRSSRFAAPCSLTISAIISTSHPGIGSVTPLEPPKRNLEFTSFPTLTSSLPFLFLLFLQNLEKIRNHGYTTVSHVTPLRALQVINTSFQRLEQTTDCKH